MSRLRHSLCALGVFALLLIAYANHFRNGFHFDETVNYIIQRGAILSSIGVVGTVVLYARAPALRRFGA